MIEEDLIEAGLRRAGQGNKRTEHQRGQGVKTAMRMLKRA